MCLIAHAYKAHPCFPLIVAANRDEFLDRPAERTHFWKDAPENLSRTGGNLYTFELWQATSTSSLIPFRKK